MSATRFISRSLFTTTKHALTPSFTPSPSSLRLLRPLSSTAPHFRRLAPSPSVATIRGFSSRPSTSSLNDPNPNWSNRPPKETILLDGCDFEHWLVVVEKPEGDPTRDDIIDSYIKTLAKIVGSEEEARKKIYSVSTRHYFAFGALVSEELSYKLKELPGVRWVLPDSYLDVKNKDYGGEPFIDGQAVPYDPKYHEEWVRNNARANERNRRNDRPRNFDRSRNFERRNMQSNQNSPNMGGGPQGNMGPPMAGGPQGNMGPPMAGGPQGNMGPPMARGPQGNMGPVMAGGPQGNMGPNMAGGPPRNMGPNIAGGPQGNMGHNMGLQHPGPNFAGGPPTGMTAPPNTGGGAPPNIGGMGGMQSNNMGNPPNYNAGSNNMGGYPNNQQNFNYGNGPNNGGAPYQSSANPNQNNFAPTNGNQYQNQNMPGRDYQ